MTACDHLEFGNCGNCEVKRDKMPRFGSRFRGKLPKNQHVLINKLKYDQSDNVGFKGYVVIIGRRMLAS